MLKLNFSKALTFSLKKNIFYSVNKTENIYFSSICSLIIFSLLMMLSFNISASISFSPGSLVFESHSQSIWGTGAAFNKEESIFLGGQWNNKTATLGGIAGTQNQLITPEIPRTLLTPEIPKKLLTAAVPKKLLTPTIPKKLLTPAIPKKQLTPAIPKKLIKPATSAVRDPIWGHIIIPATVAVYSPAVPAVYSPAIPAVYSPAIPAVYSPAIPAIYSPKIPAVYSPRIPALYGDTRTGADLKINSSGKTGIEFGYSINSGSIDSKINYSTSIQLPDTPIQKDFFISLNTNSVFDSGTIQTQSPKIEAYMSAILELSGSINASGCAIGFGCTSGSTSLPTVSVDQRILSIDPNSLKLLDGILPGDKPLAQIPILNQSVTLAGGATIAPPVVGYKVKAAGVTVFDTLPPTPSLSVDLASIEVKVPDITTNGSKSGNSVTSTGRDDILSAKIDIDGVASINGVLPPTGISFDLIDKGSIKIGGSLDLIDVDAGPVLGIAQDFKLTPTLMVNLDFSELVKIQEDTEVLAITTDSWTGLWSDIPDLALFGTTTVTPTFWIEAILMTGIDLDVGLEGTLDLLKLSATGTVAGVDIIKFGPLTLNDLLGIDNKLFETDKLEFSIYDDEFKLAGFNSVIGDSFVLKVVPIPGAFWFFFASLGTALFTRHKQKIMSKNIHGTSD